PPLTQEEVGVNLPEMHKRINIEVEPGLPNRQIQRTVRVASKIPQQLGNKQGNLSVVSVRTLEIFALLDAKISGNIGTNAALKKQFQQCHFEGRLRLNS